MKQRTHYRWDPILHGNSTAVVIGQQIIQDFAADGTRRDKATTFAYSSTTNDLLTTVEYGEVTSNGNGTFTDIGTDKRTTTLLYAASTSINMSAPIQKTIFDYASTTVSNQKLYYDSLPFGQITLGNNTKQEDWISGGVYASTTKTFNSYGLVATSTDRNGNASSYVYDQHYLYVATSTNALLQKTQFLYNYSNGKLEWKSDPNGSLTRNIFDGLGRLTEAGVSATSSPTSYATVATYAYTDSTSTPSSILRSDWLFPANKLDTYQYFDGFDRLIQERKESPMAGTYFVTARAYNGAGLVASTTLPYASSGSSYTVPSATNALYTRYLYDALQRVTTETNAVGSITNSYDRWNKTTTDRNGNVKDYWSDAFGNLVNVVEHMR